MIHEVILRWLGMPARTGSRMPALRASTCSRTTCPLPLGGFWSGCGAATPGDGLDSVRGPSVGLLMPFLVLCALAHGIGERSGRLLFL